MNIFFKKSGKLNKPKKIYSPRITKHSDATSRNILFICAFSGCDTNSSTYNVGKMKFIKTLEKHPKLVSAVELFKQETVDPTVLASAGERFYIALYGGNQNEKSIDHLRYKRFVKSVTKSKCNISSLPPTKDTARQHSFRTYHQVQAWLANDPNPENWGWKKTVHMYS